MLTETVKKCFDRQSAAEGALESCCVALTDVDDAAVLRPPLLFCHFARGLGDAKYGESESYTALAPILQQALGSYNDLNPVMELVLFEDAISHVCRFPPFNVFNQSEANRITFSVNFQHFSKTNSCSYSKCMIHFELFNSFFG